MVKIASLFPFRLLADHKNGRLCHFCYSPTAASLIFVTISTGTIQYACKYSDTKSDYFRQHLLVKMSGVESSGVTLALVDSSLLSCWEEMIKQGKECSLMLKHSKGKVTTTLQSTSCLTHLSLSASKKTRKKASKKKRLEGLLAYHQHLVEERGLPPSRLMLQQAAAAPPPSTSHPSQSPDPNEEQFKCDQCEFFSKSKRGLKVHNGKRHKDLQMPENLREEHEQSLNLSLQSENRDQDLPLVNADSSSTSPIGESSFSETVKKIFCHSCRKYMSPTHTCHQCGGCGKICNTRDELGKHTNTMHPLMCYSCFQFFKDKESKTKHWREIHLMNLKPTEANQGSLQ